MVPARRHQHRYLREHGVSIWDEWADENGELGRCMGRQWRAGTRRTAGPSTRSPRWCGDLKRDPIRAASSSRPGNVGELDQMALMPCHALFQFFVADGRLSCQLYQRSADIFLGVPFNIASYALLTHARAAVRPGVGDFVWTGGDCHLYLNHLEQADLQLSREPLPLPTLVIRRRPPTGFRLPVRGFRVP